MEHAIVAVALPLPVLVPFSYRVPSPPPEPGVRVLVPFRGRRVVGFVTGPGEEAPGMKDVLEVLDEKPLPPLALMSLVPWMADHYLAPLGECWKLLFPPSPASSAVARLSPGVEVPEGGIIDALQDGPLTPGALRRRLGKDVRKELGRLQEQGIVSVEQRLDRRGFRRIRVAELRGEAPERRGGKGELISRLREKGGRAPVADLVRDRPSLRRAIALLEKEGVIILTEETELRSPERLEGGAAPPEVLTVAQESVLGPIEKALNERRFETFLLRGVTGSGKTEVYLRAAARAIDAGSSALLLVPEIALTPFLIRTAASRFGSLVSVLHSDLSVGERHDEWWRIRNGESRVVVGARSAVFAPVANLGLVVVDEEHEAAYKQEEAPRYHARNVAVKRAQLENAVAILGSATPSLESASNAEKGKYTLLLMPERVGARELPKVEIVDRRKVLKGGGSAILTPPLREALSLRLDRGEQALLLLNRRGYATSLLCRECGESVFCPSCSVTLTLHEGGRTALCHYCGFRTPVPKACTHCGGEYMRLSGFGTETVVEEVTAAFPNARVDRLDRDTASRRGSVEKVLLDFEARRTDILVGTQMIAKGHDFPGVTLVGVVDADVGLGHPDFRAAERTFQLLTQVSGRAGRGSRPGEVILQSHLPDHYALRLACVQDYPVFFEREMEYRKSMAYPPAAALLNLIVRSRNADRAAQDAQELAEALRAAASGRFRVLGPGRAPLARLKGEYRYQILLKGSRPALGEAVRAVLTERFGALRWPGVVVDVDPQSVL